MRFMTCQSESQCWSKTHILNLRKADKPELHHFCFTVENYQQQQAMDRLRALKLEPEERGNTAYFRDPDGFVIQLGDRSAS